MQTHDKETLISLSLAGAIGYYLFNKLSEAGLGLEMKTTEYGVEGDEKAVQEETEPATVLEDTEDLFEDETVEEEVVEYYDEDDFDLTEEQGEETPVLFDDMVELPNLDEQEEVLKTKDEKDGSFDEDLLDDFDKFDDIDDEPEQLSLKLEEPTHKQEEIVFCGKCGHKNMKGFSFCNNCGNSLVEKKEEPFKPFEESDLTPQLDNPFAFATGLPTMKPVQEQKPAPVVEEVQPVVEEPVAPTVPTLNLGTEGLMDDIGDIDDIEDMDDIDDMMDDDMTDLFNTGLPTKVMENTEALHKVNDDVSSKKEYKSIMDFLGTI